jgi:peptidoglycan-N-acetylglucosamine deacetylase
MKIKVILKASLTILITFLYFNARAQKQIAITIDDPNTNKTPVLNWQERNDAILKTLDKHKIKVALFVCGMRVNDTNGVFLLNTWDAKEHLICNHSYSHLYYNSDLNTSRIFIADFKKGDSVIRNYKNYTRLFRFPFLKEGNTAAKRDLMRTALTKDNYKNGHVTIDASDWYIDSEIAKALKNNPDTDLAPYKAYYIKHILNRTKYYDSLAHLILKRDIKHTLLIHHSLLNALFLDDLLLALKNNGWELIDAKKAFTDDVFLKQPLIAPCGESIVWQCAELDKKLSKNLRYPAEDGEYEIEPLKLFIKEYGTIYEQKRATGNK